MSIKESISFTDNCFKAPILKKGPLCKILSHNNAKLITQTCVIPRNHLSRHNYNFYTQPFNLWSLGKCSISNHFDPNNVLLSSSVSSSYYVELYKNIESAQKGESPIGWSYHSTNLYGNANQNNKVDKLQGKESVTYVIEVDNVKYGFVSENVLVMTLKAGIDSNTTGIEMNNIQSYETSFPGILANGETSIAFQQFIDKISNTKLPRISISCSGFLQKKFSNEALFPNIPKENTINITGVIQCYRWDDRNVDSNFKFV
jgi:hypothetical protein